MTLAAKLTSPLVVGGTLVLIGLHQFNLLPFFNKNEFGSMNITIPVINMSVTPLQVLGGVAIASGGIMLLRRAQYMDAGDFVPMMAEAMEGGRAWGHL